ncbi:MAG: rhodanese-like domain-containing protein [Phycisphaerales bacterium]
MLERAIGQGVLIGLAALAIGTAHALIQPVRTLDSVPLPPLPTPKPTQPSAPTTPTPTHQSQPASPTKPTDTPPAQPAPQRNERMITLERVKELMSGSLPLQIVDAREPAEFQAGRIPGAINIPPSTFSGGMPDVVAQRLSRDLPLVVYCSGGNCDASKSVAMRLIDLGFLQTYVYEDGYTGWTKAGEAVEK